VTCDLGRCGNVCTCFL